MVVVVGYVLVCVLGSLAYLRRQLVKHDSGQGTSSNWFVLMWMFVGVPALAVLSLILVGEAPIFHPAYLVPLILLFPDLPVRWVLIPAGRVRAAYTLSLLANFTWTLRPKTGALCAGLLARIRHKNHCADMPVDRWLQRRATAHSGPLVSTDLLAEALSAVIDDQNDRARILMETIVRFPPKACGRRDSKLAREWLLLDAAHRGAWVRIPLIHGSWNNWTRLGAFLSVASKAFSGQGFSKTKLVVCWLSAPRPWATLPLMRRVWSAPRQGSPAAAQTPRDAIEALDAALKQTARASSPRAVVEAWTAVLQNESMIHELTRRARDSGVDPQQVLQLMRAGISETVAEPAAKAGMVVDGDVLEDQHARLLSRLEASAEFLERRIRDAEPGEPSEILAAWCAIRRRFDEALAAGITLPLAYYQVETALWNWAAQLFNHGDQKALAHSIFVWIHDHAHAVGDQRTVAHMRDNMKNSL